MTTFQLAEYRAFRSSGLSDHEAYQAALAWVPDAKPAPYVQKGVDDVLTRLPTGTYQPHTSLVADAPGNGWWFPENALRYTYFRLLDFPDVTAAAHVHEEYNKGTVPAVATSLAHINCVLETRHKYGPMPK